MARYDKAVKKYHSEIQKYYSKYPNLSNTQLAKLITKEALSDVDSNYLRKVIGAWKSKREESPKTETLDIKDRKGLEIRGDHIVINWDNKTIITDLGQYGNYVASFDRHGLIQRKYVYGHGNETASIVAMEFDFPHTKAVYQYAKHHGFTKASPGQTDLEFEIGMTVEEAVDENIQTLKRRVYKQTQKREWSETVKAAGKWWEFEDTVLEAIQAVTGELSTDKVDRLPSIIKTPKQKDFCAVIGITDVHYLKLCYNHKGEVVYDRKIASERLKEHTRELATQVGRFGKPDNFIIMIGNDNIHVDGTHHSTTKQTSQHEATDGLWRLEFKNYVRMQIDLINHYKQISDVVLLPVKGNHDMHTSIALQAFMSIYFENDPQVEVVDCSDDRVFYRYGKNCFMATHGDELGSIKNLESKAHQIILGEAKNQGIDVMEVEQYYVLHGHEHKESLNDLNGNVERIGFKSLSGEDDYWHKQKGYTGRSKGSMSMIVDKNKGKLALLYV